VNIVICQECHLRPATLHFTKIINGEKTEFHLCEHCAKEKGEFSFFGGSQGFSINNLLAGLFNVEPVFQKVDQNPFVQPDELQCDYCHMTFQQFVNTGKFGCSHCYKTFADHIDSILKRLHGGNNAHHGKIPKRKGGALHLKKKIAHLKQQLQSLVAKEEFEKAAQVRDEIRSLESQINQEGGENHVS
jgi:protein arginine kinase activator